MGNWQIFSFNENSDGVGRTKIEEITYENGEEKSNLTTIEEKYQDWGDPNFAYVIVRKQVFKNGKLIENIEGPTQK